MRDYGFFHCNSLCAVSLLVRTKSFPSASSAILVCAFMCFRIALHFTGAGIHVCKRVRDT